MKLLIKFAVWVLTQKSDPYYRIVKVKGKTYEISASEYDDASWVNRFSRKLKIAP